MASHSCSTLVFNLPHQKLGSKDIIKKNRAYLVNLGGERRRRPESLFNLKLQHLKPLKHFEFDLNQESTKRFQSSLEKTRIKDSPKKHENPKIRDREKDLCRRNQLHACESLISLMIGNEQHRQTTMLYLKKSSCGREDLLELLTRFSISIAGTGIAVFFSVASRLGVPVCANKVFDIALSLSLVLLSWTVSRLKEAIVDVNKKTIKEEEVTKNRVERRIKEVYFRAVTVFVMMALRFG